MEQTNAIVSGFKDLFKDLLQRQFNSRVQLLTFVVAVWSEKSTWFCFSANFHPHKMYFEKIYTVFQVSVSVELF